MMTELEQSIKSYFGVIQQEDLQKIISLFNQENILKGDYFIKSGSYNAKLSFIKSGYLRIFESTVDKEVTQWISSKGYFITDLNCLLFGQPARRNVQALTDVDLYTINSEDYQQIGNLVPKWHELEKLFIGKCFTIMEDRIFNHLSLSAEERYEYFFKSNRDLFNQVPLQYIASMLGMTPETFSRIRKKLT